MPVRGYEFELHILVTSDHSERVDIDLNTGRYNSYSQADT